MELEHLAFKLFIAPPPEATVAALVPVFHSWITAGSAEELLIDVADYRHVPEGPGVVLIGFRADYSLDHCGGRWGIRYYRKAPLAGGNLDRLLHSARATLNACRRLQADSRLSGGIRLDGHEFEIQVCDRLLAPNNTSEQQEFTAELAPFLERFLRGGPYRLTYDNDPRSLLAARVTSEQIFELDHSLS